MAIRTINFHPIFSVEVDTETGNMRGSWDWSDSCEGEWSSEQLKDVPTPLHSIVCVVLDGEVGKDGPFIELPALPASKYVAIDADTGESWGAIVEDAREAAEAKLGTSKRNLAVVEVTPATIKAEGGLA